MIYIRTDANEIIGTGHVMRCLSIAARARSVGEAVCFIIADERSRPLIESRGFEAICLNSVWDRLDLETDRLIDVIGSRKIDTLLIDTYYVTFSYLSELRKHTKTAYIDDLHEFAYPVDLLINYNIFANEVDYRGLYAEGKAPTLALGCEFAPLREEFGKVHKHINRSVKSVLITTGGTDRYSVTERLIEGFKVHKRFSDLDFYFVLGRFNDRVEDLKKSYGKYENIHFLVNIPNMEKYMEMCDIAVTAGGTTTYELCACGIPSIMYTLADNQFEIAKTVSERGLIPWAGDMREDPEECVRKVLDHFGQLCENYDLRRERSGKMRVLCDGRGAERIVSLLTDPKRG